MMQKVKSISIFMSKSTKATVFFSIMNSLTVSLVFSQPGGPGGAPAPTPSSIEQRTPQVNQSVQTTNIQLQQPLNINPTIAPFNTVIQTDKLPEIGQTREGIPNLSPTALPQTSRKSIPFNKIQKINLQKNKNSTSSDEATYNNPLSATDQIFSKRGIANDGDGSGIFTRNNFGFDDGDGIFSSTDKSKSVINFGKQYNKPLSNIDQIFSKRSIANDGDASGIFTRNNFGFDGDGDSIFSFTDKSKSVINFGKQYNKPLSNTDQVFSKRGIANDGDASGIFTRNNFGFDGDGDSINNRTNLLLNQKLYKP